MSAGMSTRASEENEAIKMKNKAQAKKNARKKSGGQRDALPFVCCLFPISTIILPPLIQYLPRAGQRQNRS